MPSDILKDRLDVAFQAYEEGKIKKILVSGDNSESYYNEPEVMKDYLV
jgi:SanA protein